jgi:polar amino acid transport system substrate-binding protein
VSAGADVKGDARDLALVRLAVARGLERARILRSPTSPTVVDTFLEQGADVAAGVGQQLQADARRIGGLRLLDGRFMVIQQAMGTPKSRGGEAAAFLAGFVEQMKANGFVAAALERHQVRGASVAPAAQ